MVCTLYKDRAEVSLTDHSYFSLVQIERLSPEKKSSFGRIQRPSLDDVDLAQMTLLQWRGWEETLFW